MTSKERLERLKVILEKVESGELKEIDGHPTTFNTDVWHCGTEACAIGWACADPVLRAEGLYMSPEPPRIPCYERFTSWEAVTCFLEITIVEAGSAFKKKNYFDKLTIRDVIENVKELIARK